MTITNKSTSQRYQQQQQSEILKLDGARDELVSEDFSIIDKGIVRKKRVFTIECRNFFSKKYF